MTPERYLRRYDDLNCDLIETNAEIEKLQEERARLYAESTPRPDGMPRPPGPGDPVAKLVEKIGAIDLRIDYLRLLKSAYEQRQAEIEKLVGELDVDERNVARLRYMRPRQMRWDEIARVLNFSERQCRRIDKALLRHVSQKMSVNGHKNVL